MDVQHPSMSVQHPSMSVLRPLSKPSGNYFQSQGTYINDDVPRHAHAQHVPQTRPKFTNVQQSYQHNGWTPENFDPAPGSSPDRSVKVREIQSYQSRVTASVGHSEPNLSTEKKLFCRTKAALNEAQPHHRDIPLHRSPGKTDLTHFHPDVNAGQPETTEVKPSTNDYKPNLCELKPDTNDYKPNLCELKPDTNDYKHNLCELKPDTNDYKHNLCELKPNLCELKPDHNFRSNRVFSLNRHNFRPFLDNTDLAMVLFYEPDIPDYSELLKKYSAASCFTQRPGHAYAAVNCATDHQLCLSNDVERTPQITVYSFGNVVRALAHPEHLQEVHLRKFVEQEPTSLPP